jgi:response regulator RpfG family c-di-GMP phosphodiesterase
VAVAPTILWVDDELNILSSLRRLLRAKGFQVRQAIERKALVQEKRRLEALTFQQNEELTALNASLEVRVQARTAELSVANESLQSANDKLKGNFVTTLKVFSTLIEMRGGSLAGHSRRVADLARRIA